MEYNEALKHIHSFRRFGSRLGLDRMEKLLELLGNPEKSMKVIHVAGTNGKGSVCRNLYSILQAQGYKTGLYTSPYLERFTERIEFDGRQISEDELAQCATEVFEKIYYMTFNGFESPTEFEIITAIAFHYYSKQPIDYLILEVGLGGRGDATNIIDQPLASIITTISYDHTEYLGNTLEKIAFEKAGIIKKNCPVITCVKEYEALKVIEQACQEKDSELIKVPYHHISNIHFSLEKYSFDFKYNDSAYHNIALGMLGVHQIENAATAITAVELLKEKGLVISTDAIYKGLKEARQNGRFEIISSQPLIIIDGAHNIQGINMFKNTVEELFNGKKILLCIGFLRDKDVHEMVDALAPLAKEIIVTEPNNDRKMEASYLKSIVNKYSGSCHDVPDSILATDFALQISSNFDVILFVGSLYLIGKVRGYLMKLRMEN